MSGFTNAGLNKREKLSLRCGLDGCNPKIWDAETGGCQVLGLPSTKEVYAIYAII